MALDDGGAQIDPATLPENIELIQQIDELVEAEGSRLAAPASGAMRELLVEALEITVAGLAAALTHRNATHPLEEDLRGGLAAALARSDAAVLTEGKLRLPGWTPNLGGFDAIIVGTDGSVVLIETKWGAVWQAMWDVMKLTSASQHPRVTAAYAIYAASRKEWQTRSDLGLFGDWESTAFVTDFWLAENAHDWERNLQGSAAYPTVLPGAVELEAIAAVPVTLLDTPYEIRAIAVRAAVGKPVALEHGRLTR